jgi:hypothetical protein
MGKRTYEETWIRCPPEMRHKLHLAMVLNTEEDIEKVLNAFGCSLRRLKEEKVV